MSIDILSLIGIDSEAVEGEPDVIIDEEGLTEVFVKYADKRTPCPKCHSKEIISNGYKTVTIRHSVLEHRNLIVLVTKHYYKCKKCSHCFVQNTIMAHPRKSISVVTLQSMYLDFQTNMTFSAIAKKNNVSVTTAMRTFDSVVPTIGRLAMPRILCLDEFHFKHLGRCKFPCVLTDFWTGKIVDIVESRTEDYMIGYFAKIGLQERHNVRYFVTDMNESYRRYKKLFFPDSIHIVDTFHVVLLFNSAINRMRTRMMKMLPRDSWDYSFMKSHWQCFLKSSDKVSNKMIISKKSLMEHSLHNDLVAVLDDFPALREACLIRDDFLGYRKSLGLSESRDFVKNFIGRCEGARASEMKEVGVSLSNWYEEIVNSFAENTMNKNITNAKAESNNNLIEKLNKEANGYHSFKRFRKRVLFWLRSVDKK